MNKADLIVLACSSVAAVVVITEAAVAAWKRKR